MPEPAKPAPRWIDVLPADRLPVDDVTAVEADGREIALYTCGGAVYATDNLCSHGTARLCEGFLDGHVIECPLHQGRFDVRSGQATYAPATEALRCYPVKLEGGRVFLQID